MFTWDHSFAGQKAAAQEAANRTRRPMIVYPYPFSLGEGLWSYASEDWVRGMREAPSPQYVIQPETTVESA